MPPVCRYETVDPAVLNVQALEAFGRELFVLHTRIFTGVDEAQFRSKVFNPEARWCKIRLFRSVSGTPVGYCALHAFDKEIRGKSVAVFRTETGLLKEYRRQGRVTSFLLTEALRHRLRHPLQKSYFFCTLVHPSSYHLIDRFFFRSYPSPSRPCPADLLRTLEEIAQAFHELAPPGLPPGVRQVGWVTRESPEEARRWQESPDPGTRFFLERNPGYGRGEGLMVLVPLTHVNVWMTALGFLGMRAVRALWSRKE